MVQHAHSNIYAVSKIFKDAHNTNKFSRRAGGAVSPLSKKYATIKRKLQMLRNRYQDGIIDLMTPHLNYYILDKDLVTVTDSAIN